jgi:uncharacterized protein YfbU (UPF0304 family)
MNITFAAFKTVITIITFYNIMGNTWEMKNPTDSVIKAEEPWQTILLQLQN